MKIAYVFTNYHLANITAQAGIMQKLADKARQQGHQVFILSNAPKSHLPRPDSNYLIIEGEGVVQTFFYKIPAIISFLRKKNPDVVHVNGAFMMLFIWVINYLIRKPLFAFLSETHDDFSSIKKFLTVVAIRSARRVYVASRFLSRHWMDTGISLKKIEFVSVGLNPVFLKPPTINKHDSDVLFFGDSYIERGIADVYQVALLLPRVDFQVLIRKKGKNGSNYLRKLEKMNNVSVLFYPYKKPLMTYLTRARIIFLPIRWMLVRPPISLVEALALGKCVITSKLEGNEEVVTPGKTGFLINFDNHDKIANKIKQLLKNRTLRQRIEKGAQKKIQRLYTSREYNRIIHSYKKYL